MMTFETLPGLPATGEPPELFSPTGQGAFREDLVVRVVPTVGSPWSGNFQPGIGGFSGVAHHPDRSRLVVVSGGQAYVVDPTSRRAEIPKWSAIARIHEIADLRLLVFDHQGIRFEALCDEGVRWKTRRISWDGFREVVIVGSTLSGEAWNAMGDQWDTFSVNLQTGAASGGSYKLADGSSWERLYDPGQAS